MRTLDKKLVRDLSTMKGQLAALVLIMACGVASLVTLFTVHRGLEASRAAYYGRYRMADIFAGCKRAPRSVLHHLENVPGVREAQGRIVFDVTLDLPDLEQPCSGRIVSVPDVQVPALCDLHLVTGSWFTGDGHRETIVADRFARLHGIRVGDSVSVLMNDRKESLRVVATALSPEFVYMIRGAGDVLPDFERFTILWCSESFAEAVFNFEEAMNDVIATLDRDADPQAAISAFDDALDRYGGFGAYELEDQASNRFLSEEIAGLEAMARIVPLVFLGISAFILHVLMSRLVETQRAQFALFRAFGYRRAAIHGHVLKFALVVGGLGAVVGVGAGLLMARGMLGVYQKFYDLPVLAFSPDAVAMLAGAGTSLGFAVLGGWRAVRVASRLSPAEGMRPAMPPAYGRTMFERIEPLWRRLGFASRMVVRHVARNALRSGVTAFGVALATSIVVFSLYVHSAWDELVDVQYRLIERQDAGVTFHEGRGMGALREVRAVSGVLRAEPELIVPAELVHGRRTRRVALRGLSREGEMRALLDKQLRPVSLPESGLLLTRNLADLLAVEVGDELEVRVLVGRKPHLVATVGNIVDEYIGVNAYIDFQALSRQLGEEDVLTGALLRTDPEQSLALGAALKSLPSVASVQFKAHMLETLEETVQGSQQIMNFIIIFFAGIIAFGALYNTARISLSQRGRELASLRVLGFTSREVGSILSREGLLLTAVGVVPGMALGALLSFALARANQSDLFAFPFVMTARDLVVSALVIFAFSILANALVLRRARRADLVEVLKAGE